LRAWRYLLGTLQGLIDHLTSKLIKFKPLGMHVVVANTSSDGGPGPSFSQRTHRNARPISCTVPRRAGGGHGQAWKRKTKEQRALDRVVVVRRQASGHAPCGLVMPAR
jgi:hypothetical protein